MEVQMLNRIATATALALMFAGPAFADCAQELKAIEQNVVSAETGASTNQSGMPVTKHQEELLPGKQGSGDPETTASTGTVKPTSPHQEQVTGTATAGEHASQVMAEARKMAEAGDEQGCMKKLAELKEALGAK
jgi:hypothetical protein